MTQIDPQEYQKSLDRLSGILAGIATHADVQATFRCPYKNRFDQCTAHFGCRNQRKPKEPGETTSAPICCDGWTGVTQTYKHGHICLPNLATRPIRS